MNDPPLYSRFRELLDAMQDESVLTVFDTIRQLIRDDERIVFLGDTIKHIHEQEEAT